MRTTTPRRRRYAPAASVAALAPTHLCGALAIVIMILTALLPAGAVHGQDQVGIYWDQGYTQNALDLPTTYTPATGHLVITDPSSGGGILGWECRVDVTGPAMVSGWNLAGQAINAASPPQFSVGLAAPLPPGNRTAVMSFDIFVTEIAPVEIALEPIFFASIPGEMAYLGADNPEQLTVMAPATGTPVVATINADVPVAAVDPVTLRFGEVGIGVDETLYFEVTNVGGGVLSLDIALDCPSPGYYLTRTGPVDLAAGESVQVGVRFAPVSTDELACAVNLGEGVPQVFLLGRGRELVLSWSDPRDIDFGARPVGSLTYDATWIQNTGEVQFGVDVQWVGDEGPFTIAAGAGPGTIQPGLYRNVSVRFTPTVPGTWTRTLSFGPGLPEVQVTGEAFWGTPDFEIRPSYADFPGTDVGETRIQVFEVANLGTGAFEITPNIVPSGSPFTVSGEGTAILVPGGGTHLLQVAFTPPAEEFYTAELALGDGFPLIALSGLGGPGYQDCVVSPNVLEIVVPTVSDQGTGIFVVENTGTQPLVFQPTIDRPEFVILTDLTQSLPPGESVVVEVAFAPAGPYAVEASLVLGPGACVPVTLRGRTDIGIEPGTNQVGLFFDTGFTEIERTVNTTPTTVPVHLALLGATNTSGVAGWECLIRINGEAVFSDVRLAGNAINAGDPANGYEFAVGIGLEPLPYAADGILLASFDLLVTDPDPNNVFLQLVPLQQPSLPGLMAWVPWDDITALTPMVPITGQPTVAWLTSSGPVGLGAPTPRAEQTGGAVTLAWEATLPDVDGYHVYRRVGATPRQRLTPTPLPATGGTMHYVDRAAPPAGTVAHYSYAALSGGAEIATSPEVEVVVAGGPPAATALLGNVPNPFNPETRIRFRLAAPGQVRVRIYDVYGRLVHTLVDGRREAGEQGVTWRGRDEAGRPVSSGAYYVRLETRDGVDHRKIMLVK